MLVIRKATPGDVPIILRLVKGLATYEKEPDAVVATEADFLRDGFGENPRFEAILAQDGTEVIGFALFFFHWSTWEGRAGLYLEDLFVEPERRGRGAGMALMRELAKTALERGCRSMKWVVLDWNEPSIAFCEKLGAKVDRQWLSVKLTGEALARLSC